MMKREALLIGPDELAGSLASLKDWSAYWRFTPDRRAGALDRLRRTSGLPDCIILHLRSVDHSTASEVLEAARAAGVRAAIAADHDVMQMRSFLGLAQTDALEFIPGDSEKAGLARAFFTAFPRTSIHSRFVRALSPRLTRLPDSSLAAVCLDLIPRGIAQTLHASPRQREGGAKPLSTPVHGRPLLTSRPSASGLPFTRA